MNFFLPAIIACFYLLIICPMLRIYQLKGYSIKILLNNFNIIFVKREKNKLVLTKRMLRFAGAFLIIEYVLWVIILTFISNFWLIFLDFLVNFILLFLIFILIHFILLPVEIFIKKYYIKKTKEKLAKFKGIKIAITGSFGKTSTKNALNKILSECYNVCCSPGNYNTPMGLCKTVLEHMNGQTEILIVEMGARHKGDIKELCDILNPDIGIVTSIGEQHLETFGSIEKVLDTKFELCESLIQKGICFFDCVNENTLRLYKRASCKKVSLNSNDIIDEKITRKGTSFGLKRDENILKIDTCLLGKHMIKNIALSILVAQHLGLNEQQIKKGTKSLRSTKHRLEIIKTKPIIIDDSYNSNYVGFCEALNVLSLFDQEKIIITPGVVELGEKQYETNFKLGKLISKTCDKVIIMNQTNKIALKNGILSENNRKLDLFFADNMQQQKEILNKILNKDCVVLFENDLPDDYK